MAKSLSELKKMQRTQLIRLTKEDLIESILAIPDSNEGALKELINKFQDLMKEVVELKLAVTSPDSTINKRFDNLQSQVTRQAEVIANQQRFLEILDRKEREKNIIVIGVPDENEALEGTTCDEEKLNKIWAKVDAGEEVRKYRRLGTHADNRRRPILVEVDSKEARDRILGKTAQLKQSGDQFSRIFIKKDVHPSIRAEWKRLREAEKREKERPENAGCVIRLDTRERKLLRDNVVIDEWKQQGF